jgi:ATP adenylyltransferase/5',5'''-P-1,P-4-tetraphosphate phosphorylase II
MSSPLILSDNELHRFTDSADWADKAYALLAQQEETWDLLARNYRELSKVKSRDLSIDGSTYRLQFNPGRITSTAANVDEQAIRQRACFLCSANLPALQRGLKYTNDYVILCNPFPIFQEHFTIPHREHVPQQIGNSFPMLLRLAQDLSERYVVLYNGPKCGASAPDHLHFQAGEKGFLPIEDEYEDLITSEGEKIADIDGMLVFGVANFLRRFVSLESDNATLLQKAFALFHRTFQEIVASDEEPMMNIVCSFQDGEWRVMIFPRAKHRPSFFFEPGEKKMLISPAAVDLGGVIITPVEKDFRAVTKEHLVQMFDEVSIARDVFAVLTNRLGEKLATLNLEP